MRERVYRMRERIENGEWEREWNTQWMKFKCRMVDNVRDGGSERKRKKINVFF